MMQLSREMMVELLWKKAEETVFVTRDEFITAMDPWEFYPVYSGKSLLAIVGEAGPHIHFEIVAPGRSISRKIVRDVLQRVIDKNGFAVTKTPKQETRQRRFNELIGFEMVGEDEYDIHYRITRVRGTH